MAYYGVDYGDMANAAKALKKSFNALPLKEAAGETLAEENFNKTECNSIDTQNLPGAK